LSALNPRQKEAVRYTDGPLLVLAGAGSGKTATITRKIAWLIESGLSPAHIVAVTFTNKAAREMKTRVKDLLGGKEGKGLTVSTFHTLGLNILRKSVTATGYKPNFSIFNADDSVALLRELARKASITSEQMERAQWQISHWKNQLLTPDLVAHEQPDAAQLAAARLYTDYQRQLRAYNAVDFDDLILQPVLLFQAQPTLLTEWRERIHYLLVDEYQDTNSAQYALVKQLVGARGALTVVGDDDQSVYAWRGAQPENLRLLQTDFPDLKVIKLEQNYRSSGRILKAANTLIANNPHLFEKSLWSDLGYGDRLRVLRARNEEHEAERVVSQLLHHKFQHRTEFRDYAILYRGNHQARPFERVLREHRIPYYLSGGMSFFDYGEIKDVMAYLRLLCNPDDDNAFLRIINTPRREIGAATLEKLARFATGRGVSLYASAFEPDLDAHLNDRALASVRRFVHWVSERAEAAQGDDPVGCVRGMLDDIAYAEWLKDTSDDLTAAERRLENVLELVGWIERLARQNGGEKSLGELVGDLSLIGMLEREDDGQAGDNVALMTLHAAKGLEFPHVFIVGMEEDLLPHRTSVLDGNVEEERRLAYVGITRARKTLTFSLAKQRKRYGELIDCEPSRFLGELPTEDLEWEGATTDPEQKLAHGEAHLANLRSLLK
jgi:ATP-dependent DNA helicase Rep